MNISSRSTMEIQPRSDQSGVYLDVDDSANYWKVTPLHIACLEGREACVRDLVARGADVNARFALDKSCLHAAAESVSGLQIDYNLWSATYVVSRSHFRSGVVMVLLISFVDSAQSVQMTSLSVRRSSTTCFRRSSAPAGCQLSSTACQKAANSSEI